MRRGYDRFVEVLEAFASVLLVVLVGVVLAGVFYRYVVDDALTWYDEFAGYLLVWLTMYGSVLALARGKHIGFDTLVERLPERGRRLAEAFGTLCVMGFSLVLLVTGWQLVREMEGETAISLPHVEMAWIYSVMPISGGLMLLVGAARLVRTLSAGPGPEGARAHPSEEAR